MVYYNTSCNTHGNYTELQRDSIWLWIVCDRWQHRRQLVRIATQIASSSLLPDIDLWGEPLWKQTEQTVTFRAGCQFQMSGLCYCRSQNPVHHEPLDILIDLAKQGGLAIQTPVSLLHQQVACILNTANSTYWLCRRVMNAQESSLASVNDNMISKMKRKQNGNI